MCWVNQSSILTDTLGLTNLRGFSNIITFLHLYQWCTFLNKWMILFQYLCYNVWALNTLKFSKQFTVFLDYPIKAINDLANNWSSPQVMWASAGSKNREYRTMQGIQNEQQWYHVCKPAPLIIHRLGYRCNAYMCVHRQFVHSPKMVSLSWIKQYNKCC